MLNPIDVVRIANAQDIPSIAEESACDVFREGKARVALDRDVIVVIDPAEFIQAQMPRQRRRLGRDALHQAAVAANGVNAIVKNIESRPVVARRQPLLGYGYASACGDVL